MYHVYILENPSGRHYIGCAKDLNKRLIEHNAGKVFSTTSKRPWKIIYSEKFLIKTSAFLREKQIKSYKGGEAFKKILEGCPSG